MSFFKLNTDVFYLMHKNSPVVLLQIDLITGSIMRISEERESDLIPLGGQMSNQNFKKWWENRAVPSTRKGVQAALNFLDISSTKSLLVANLGLSLTDHYWIKPIDSDFTWEQVTLYTNDFSDSIGEFQFTQQEQIFDLTGKTTFCPSASLQGELKKKWLIGDDGTRFLAKGNHGLSCQQSLNEVFASEIHCRQGIVPYVDYKLTTIDTNEGSSIGCISKNFTTTNIEFIPAYEVNLSCKKRNDCSEYEFFIQVCTQNGLDENYVRKFLEYQIMTDFVISNTDRHFNNFGVLRDSNSLKFVSMAPIYDSGNSLFWDTPSVPRDLALLTIQTNSFKKKELDLLDYIQDKNVLCIDKLPSRDELFHLLTKDTNVTFTRLENIANAYEQKKELLQAFVSGEILKKRLYTTPYRKTERR